MLLNMEDEQQKTQEKLQKQQQQQQQQPLLSSAQQTAQPRRPRSLRTDRPCDVCRKRKLKCVKEAQQDKCVLCLFHSRECTYRDEPQRRKSRRTSRSGGMALTSSGAVSKNSDRPSSSSASSAVASLLDCSLGLHRTTHFRYIGPGSLHECVLLSLAETRTGTGTGTGSESTSRFRRVDGTTAFVARADRHTPFSTEDADDIETIENLVRPHGPALVSLYFRTVHPSYPILHKSVFLEKYARGYREFSPPLLAAVYLLAMDWWEYDEQLTGHARPDSSRLIQTATKALAAVVHRPKLSTVQAGLLLLQRSGGDSWVQTSQTVAVAEELGLHVDCSGWAIPDWERRLRRRLAWAVFMQDKWGALMHGRPSHIATAAASWRLSPLSLDDFPEAADDDDKETEMEKGRLLFIYLSRLTTIMAEGAESLYGYGSPFLGTTPATPAASPDASPAASDPPPPGLTLLDRAKPVAVQLKAWASALPAQLRMEDVTARKLCCNGYLNLAYFVAEIMVCRFIVRALPADAPPNLRQLCREAARVRLEHAMRFVEALRPEHLQAFWWFASPRSLAYIATYGALLWATSTTEDEADFYRQKLDEFRWSLKVRAKGVAFVQTALQEMEESLQDLDMSRSPVSGRTSEVGQTIYVRTELPPRRAELCSSVQA